MIKLSFDNLSALNLSYSPSSPLNIEGDLVIQIEGRTFLREPSISIVEFSKSLRSWFDSFECGLNKTFTYISVEVDEVVILQFLRCGDNLWHLYSEWQEFKCDCTIKQLDLLKSVQDFLELLEKSISVEFGLDILA